MPKKTLHPRGLATLDGPPEGSRSVIWWDTEQRGLGVAVRDSGERSFVVAYRIHGRERRYSLGPVEGKEALTLTAARKRAAEIRTDASRDGKDVIEAKARERSVKEQERLDEGRRLTIAGLIERFKASTEVARWREATRRWILAVLDREAVPRFGDLGPETLRKGQIRMAMDDIAAGRGRGTRVWAGGKRKAKLGKAPHVANSLLSSLRLLYAWAVDQELIETAPAWPKEAEAPEDHREHLDDKGQRTRVLTEPEIRTTWKGLDQEPSVVADAFKLLLITAQRRGEVLSMRWTDLAQEAGAWWWTIPSERTKNKKPHRVPLSPQAMTVLESLRSRAGDSPWVFPSDKGSGHIVTPGHAAQRLKKRTGLKDVHIHDSRRTAASYMASIEIPRFTIARVLNHSQHDVTSIYDRFAYDKEKRVALEAWGRKLDGILRGEAQPASVVPFAGRA